MRNLNSSPSTTTPTRPLDANRDRVRRIRRNRKSMVIGSAAVIAVGAVVGSGFAVQSAVADQNLRVAETAALTDAQDRGIDQLDAQGGLLEAHAVKQAEDTLAVATDTLAAAKGKADAAALASTVATLEDYTYLAPERVFELATAAASNVDAVKADIAEFDKKAAEKAAAAKAAAAKAAAEKAAAESAAAEESSSPSYPSGPANPSGAQAIARDLMSSMYGWGSDQFGCLVSLWDRESGWNVYAQNPSSGAYGIPQALPGDKMATAGADWATNAATQIKWGLGYIAGRYGTPCGAWSHSESAGWY
jgi:hypothetical protein